MKKLCKVFPILLVLFTWACNPSTDKSGEMPVQSVKLIQINPGHFHAGLVLKSMYEQVDPLVYVYAPGGPDLEDFLARLNGYNNREDQPTTWDTKIYTGPDYMEKMLAEKPGNVLVTAGNNERKTEYILKAVEAGLNVFADKPMVINPEEFPLLLDAFTAAEKQGVLLYDIMTERYEITTILQRELSMIPGIFGQLMTGTADEPAITKESVHHLFKYVSGMPLQRPGWFFDVTQQGTGVTDVGTHLVDLVQWECFPDQIIDYENDIEPVTGKAWTTVMDEAQFEKVTGLTSYPEYLEPYIEEDLLQYPCNGEMVYKLKGIYAKVSVIWNYQAPEGTGDTHFSIMRGSLCNLVIRQGLEEEFTPVLYIEAVAGSADLHKKLETAIADNISLKYPGVELEQISHGKWKLVVPDQYRIGHEAHFTQVMEKYLQFLEEGKMPEWEVPNMIAKYYTTTGYVKLTR